MKICKYGAGVFSIDGFLTDQECHEFIQMTETLGYNHTTMHDEDDSLYRFNDRLLHHSTDLADTLYQRAVSFLPEQMDDL